jgi:EmrB/QacA subfamily drug resistance transporter
MTDAIISGGPTSTGAVPAVDPRRWKALGVIALVQFMLVLDITVVNVALPHIQSDLGFSRAGLAWVVDGYTLTAGGLLLLGGRLGDLIGRRWMFLAGVGLFAVASILSGASVDPGMLVAARFLQGVGEAMASPAAFGLVALLFTEPKERAKAIGIFGGVAGLGGTLGPILSGVLIAVVSWRWIFFINVPVAVFALIAVPRLADESKAPRQVDRPRPDVIGAAIGTAGLVGVVYGLIQAATNSWGSAQVVVPLVAGAALLLGFVLQERRAAAPLVPARFLRNRTRVTANVVALFFACAFFTLFFLLTLFWQEVEHWSALRTGLAYLPVGLGIGIGIGVASSVVAKIGVKVLLTGGALLFGTGMLVLSRITAGGSYWSEALPGLVLIALGAGVNFAAMGNGSMHQVSDQDASLASGVQSTAQQIGGAVGLAVLATLALRHARTAAAHGVPAAIASTQGTVLALRVGGIVALAGGVVAAAFLHREPRGASSAPPDLIAA